MTANSKCCPNMKINLYTVSDTPKSQFSITEEIYQGKIEKNSKTILLGSPWSGRPNIF